jgi:hypothetical protein
MNRWMARESSSSGRRPWREAHREGMSLEWTPGVERNKDHGEVLAANAGKLGAVG